MPGNMEQEREAFFLEDERINKALKTVRRAVIMRLVVTALLVWIMIVSRQQIWVVGMVAFVLVINVTGSVPLVQEWRRQKKKLDELWENE